MNKHIKLHPAVANALQTGQPVIALESTLITHGLPYPANVETALAMEAAIRDQGGIPATIAILDGVIHAGLEPDQIERLAQLGPEKVRKCSRRDLPLVVGLQAHGATTVAGTMIVAHQAGIKVFATGGIGGVHRGHPQDVSADLMELGRTPVNVVCAGAKSILDLPLTLEVLETQGVPLIGYLTDELPAFYSRTSGLPIDIRVDSPQKIAAIAQARDALGMQQGLLITTPVPAEYELPAAEAEIAIAQATQIADEQGISGKEITPFVLGKVLELTEGRSREANIALLVNNAGVGAQIAAALSALQ
ncbi:pseudouridine-5'-phosphate glycosidase [Chloroflexota bacterium]